MEKDLPIITKYRPKSFDELYGNSAVIESLQSVLSRKEGIPHAFLFQGQSGCGKTTIGRIVAKILGCEDSEFIEYDAATEGGKAVILDIKSSCRYKPLKGAIRVYLLDEAHSYKYDAEKALLKLLEEPPSHVYFILCTTDPDKILDKIKNRCSIYQVQSLTPREMGKFLYSIAKKEGAEVTEAVVKEIVRVSNGSPRQALSILDQVLDVSSEEIALQTIIESTLDERTVIDIIQILTTMQPAENKWNVMRKTLKGIREEPETVRHAILTMLGNKFLETGNLTIGSIIEEFQESTFNSGKAGLYLMACKACFVK